MFLFFLTIRIHGRYTLHNCDTQVTQVYKTTHWMNKEQLYSFGFVFTTILSLLPLILAIRLGIPDFVWSPCVAMAFGWFCGAAYEWEWGIGQSVGLGSVASVTLISHLFVNQHVYTTLLTFGLALISVHVGIYTVTC